MFDFMWHLRGSVPLLGVANEAVMDRIETLLERQRKGVGERGADYIVFDAPLWGNAFRPNWLAMGIYDRGRFWIEKSFNGRTLRYDLRSLHSMVFCLFAALMFFCFGLAGGGFVSGLEFAAGAFAWLYGMNFLLALGRATSAIRRATQSAQL